MEQPPPLVSIVVITYNSSQYVLETLESAVEQTYQNLELIISDDGSADDTVALCEDWLFRNQHRFADSRVLTAEKNSGIPANCNRGLRAAKGEWIKLIAGDDILMPHGIADLLNYAQANIYRQVISKLKVLTEGHISDYTSFEKELDVFSGLNVSEKYRYYLIYPFFLNVPSLMFHRETALSLKPYDERFRLLEDQPFFYNMFRGGVDLGFLPKETVLYRVHSQSLMGSGSPALFKALYDCYLEYRKPYLTGVKGKVFQWMIEKKYKRQMYFNQPQTFMEKFWLNLYYVLVQKMTTVLLRPIVANKENDDR